jgi:PAS domain-containing protein
VERDLFIRAIEQQGFVRDFEHRTYRKDGSVFWVSVNARVVRDRRGKITHYEGTHEDIQRRKETEEALRASEERFSKAFRSNPAPIAISTIDEGRYIDANDRFLEMFGYTRRKSSAEHRRIEPVVRFRARSAWSVNCVQGLC